jgi:hypothetical protein
MGLRVAEIYGISPAHPPSDRWDRTPAELKALDQWVAWRRVVRGGNPTKLPYQPRPPYSLAKTDTPETWGTFAEAVAAASDPANGFDGIGFVFGESDPYCGIDFDNCIVGDGMEAFADGYIRSLGGYQEVSPSGVGIKVIVRADLHTSLVDDGFIHPDKSGRRRGGKGRDKKGAIEVYDAVRFFTITGDTDTPHVVIPDRQEQVEALVRDCFPRLGKHHRDPEDRPAVVPILPDDNDLLDRIRGSQGQGDLFRRLYDRGDTNGYAASNGREGKSSEADLALCNILAFWAGNDPDRIDRLFRRSALCDWKWTSRADYREWTIAKALAGRTEFYDPEHRKRDKPVKRSTDVGGDSGPKSFKTFNGFTGSQVLEVGAWPEPLSLEPAPAVPFPMGVLPAVLADYCSQSAEGMECPVDYFAAPLVVMAGGVLGLSVRLEIKPGYRVPASLYLATVGAPGTRKSPAVERVAAPLWRIDSEYSKLHREAKRARKKDDDSDPPSLRELTVDDVTREALGPILQKNPRGLVLIKDELTGWVLSQNAYKKGLGDDKQFWMSVNSCKPIKINRMGDPDAAIIVPMPFVSVVGALTPENMPVIRSDKRDDGWLDRILFSYPEAVEVGDWDDEDRAADPAPWLATAMRLRSILGADPDELDGIRYMDFDEHDRPSPRLVHLTNEAKSAWADGMNAHRREQREGCFDPSLRGPWSKMEGYAGRLALILGHLRLAATYHPDIAARPTDIDADTVSAAWTLIDYFKAHHIRARAELADGAHGGDDHGRRIAAWLTHGLMGELELGQHLTTQDTAEVKTFAWAFARRRFPRWPDDLLRSGLAWLEKRHIIATVEGRETRTIYGINPKWEANLELTGNP